MKKALKLATVIVVIIALLSGVVIPTSASAADPTVILSQVSGRAGDIVEVTVRLANNPGIVCMQLDLSYDNSALELVNVVDTGNLPGGMHDENYTSMPYTLAWLDDTAEENCYNNGVIATLTFRIRETAAGGVYGVSVSYDNSEFDIFDFDFNTYDFFVTDGAVTVEEAEPFTVNDKITVFEASLTMPKITEPSVILSQVRGNAGDSVDITVSLANNPGIVSMSLGIEYDANALELTAITDAKNLSGSSHRKNTNSLSWQNFKATENLTNNGLVATLTFKIKDTAMDGKYAVTVTYDNENSDIVDKDFITHDFDVISGAVMVGRELDSTSLVSFVKGDKTLDLLCTDIRTGELMIKSADGKLLSLRNKDGEAYILDDSVTRVAVIYNDIKGNTRYYVGEGIAYITDGEELVMANDLSVDNSFAEAIDVGEAFFLKEAVDDETFYNIGDSGTAEIVAFQENYITRAIRLLSGVDMPWYTSVGFETEVFKNGVGQGAQTFATNRIFESVISDDKTVKATEYGHEYFAVFSINEVDVSDGAAYYIIVKPYTAVGETKYYGTTTKVNIDSNGGYSFAENSSG